MANLSAAFFHPNALQCVVDQRVILLQQMALSLWENGQVKGWDLSRKVEELSQLLTLVWQV